MRRAGLAAMALALGCGLAPPDTPEAPDQAPQRQTLPPPGYVLVWADEFDGSGLDASKWTASSEHRGDALSTPAAVAVRSGVLEITTHTGADGVHRTGFLSTEGNYETVFGYFAARIRFHDAPGAWCAFWLSAPTIGNPLGDPARAGVEIDVVEHRATDQGGWDELRDMVALNLNWDGYDQNKKNVQRVLPLPDGSPVQGEWHTYAVLWTRTGYTFYVDEQPLWTTADAVSLRPEDMRLTCELDDGGWAGFVPLDGYGSLSTSTTRMEVDWVRVWQQPL